MRVFLVATDEEYARATRQILLELDVDSIQFARSAREAIETLEEHVLLKRPVWDLLLMALPAEETMGIVQMLRSVALYRMLPVVCMLDEGSLRHREMLWNAGVNASMPRSGSDAELEYALRQTVGFWSLTLSDGDGIPS